MNESKIILEHDVNGALHVQIKGKKIDLMTLLAELSSTLKEASNLTEKEIKFAIELGLKDDKELKEEAKKATEEIPEVLEKIVKLLTEM